jgi:glycosyltransferase involved in cell wall biosynthesis
MSINISIAMGTYNGGKYIQAQLDSFAKQVCPPFELVICDDGSTDNTLEVIRTFATTANFPVRIYQNEKNLGFADNFLKCVTLCKGDWVAFSDQDDIWLPEKLLKVCKLINAQQSNNLVLVCHSANLVSEDLTLTGRRIPDYKSDKIISKNNHYGFLCIPGFTITYKANLLSEIDSNLRPRDYFCPKHDKQSHDKWIPMLANALGKVAYISEPLALYRRHDLAYTGSHDKLSPIDRIQKASNIGADYYLFQMNAAKESAESLRMISVNLSDTYKKNCLLEVAVKYDFLSEICALRAKLYSIKNMFGKLQVLCSMIVKKGYWGSSFHSLGTLSLLKDLAFTLGLL